MSLSFAFIIPLNYGIITKNNLNLRRKQGGHGHLYPAHREDNMLLLPEVLDHRRFWPILVLLSRKLPSSMLSLPYLRENTAKIRENKQKLAIETVCAADFRRVFESPA